MTLKTILESLIKQDFTEKKLEELKKKFPNIPYELSFGTITSKKNEKLHSYEDQPARIYYYNNEKIREKIWYKNRKLHRDGDKTAYISYYENGKIKTKAYYKNKFRHRDNNKPAYIGYDENGKIIIVEYWVDGIEVKNLPSLLQRSEDQTRRDLDYNYKPSNKN